MTAKADWKEVVQELKDQVRILKDEKAELQSSVKEKESLEQKK